MATQYRVLLDRTAEEAAVRQSRHAVHDKMSRGRSPLPVRGTQLVHSQLCNSQTRIKRSCAQTCTHLHLTPRHSSARAPCVTCRYWGSEHSNFNFLNCASVRTTRDSDSHHQIFGPLWQRVCHAAPFWPSWVGVTKALALCTKSLR